MSYIGNSPENVLRNRRAIYEFVATAGQTAFSGVDSNGATLDLLQDNEQSVFLNGVRIIATDDYTVSGETLTLLQAASVGDILIVETQGEVANATTYTRSEADARYVNYNGDVISGNIQIAGDLTASSLAIDTDTLYVDATNNRVGINLPGLNPQEALHVAGNIRVNNNQEFRTVDTGGTTRTIMRVNGSDQLEYGWSGAGPVKFMGGGSYTERMRIHTNSNIGIGTDNPPSILSVRKTTTTYEDVLSIIGQNAPTDIMGALGYDQTSDTMIIRNDQAYATGGIAFRAGGSNNHLFIQTGGQVGIGTDAPKADFHVVGADSNNLIVQNSTYQNSGQNTEAAIRLKVTASSDDERAKAGILLKNDGSAYGRGDLHFLVDSNDDNGNAVLADSKMVISHEGKVGIGTDAPATTLNVESSSYPYVRVTNTGYTGFDIGQADSSEGGAALIKLRDAADMDFYTADLNRMRISSTGNVGIGLTTTDPSHKLHVSGDIKSDQYLLDAIAESNTDTAVDVFVYDTRKDSDGGAWRKRTQHTSWYNETLNTSTRGARKEFPAVAVITLQSGVITIYDGDDPDMPMWMKFTQSSGQSFTNGGQASYVVGGCGFATTTGINMLNGTLAVPHHGGCSANDTREGLLILNFLSEVGEWITYTASANFEFAGPISNRNTSMPLSLKGSTRSIVNTQVNDVDMTVLPNSLIDSATGLPVPTIAVATEGGASLIKDDGSVVSLTTSGTGTLTVDSISFSKDNDYISIAYGDNSATPVYVYTIPASTWSISTPNVAQIGHDGTRDSYILKTDGVSAILESMRDDFVATGTTSGLSKFNIINDTRQTLKADNVFAFFTSDYNTGWMVGDTKLATLSSTDNVMELEGTELISNGDFSNGTTGWTAQLGSNLSVSSGQLTVVSTGANSLAYQYFTADLDKSYTLKVTVVSGSGVLQTGGYGSGTLSAGTYTLNMSAGRTNNKLDIAPPTNGTMVVDNISLKLAAQDRSINGKGLQVFGVLDRDPVATGAELQGYSGWSTSNYLEQPYNSDLDFGTGDFSVVGWIKPTTQSAHHGIVNRMDSGGGPGFLLEHRIGGTLLLQTDDGTAVSNLFSSPARLGQWTQFCCTVTNSGTNLEWFMNGVSVASSTVTARDVTNTAAVLRIGEKVTESRPMDGSFALIRISGTVPSPEQIKKIYEDEKFLFQENAKATLYGTSDAVTALAYDDDTELLHVGTSAGRSVFQGLTRIDNTTDAVGSAISASNGLVAEE